MRTNVQVQFVPTLNTLPRPYADQSVLDAFEKLRKATVSFVMCVCPYGTTRLPLDRFS